MTISPPDVQHATPPPRVSSVPEFASSAGQEAVELAAEAGLHLDAAQQLILRGALGERADGKWSAFEVGVCVARQNLKGAVIEARELAGLFLFGERLILHSAHQFDTALEGFRRIMERIESNPDLDSRVARVSRSHGEEGVELKGGQRLRFKARTKAGGRGFTGDCVILDEAMILPDSAIGALMPTMSARPNPQLWYMGSAVDRLEHDHGRAFSRVRKRGAAGDDPSLAWFEWSAPDDADPDDPSVWAATNPAVAAGRIGVDYIARERRSMPDRTFRVERLSIGDWFDDAEDEVTAVPTEVWAQLADADVERGATVGWGVATAPDRSWSALAVAFRRLDGLPQVSLVDYQAGAGWVAERAAAVRARWGGKVVVDTASRGLVEGAVEPSQAAQAGAHNQFADAVIASKLRHGNEPALNVAVRAARWKPSGESRVLERRGQTDISPLVACALALHGLPSSVYEDRDILSF